MDFDKSSSSIILDVAWGNTDKKNQGFIYAKNLPELIREIELVLNRGEPTKGSRLLSNTGQNVIDTFAREKEFFKIYKDEFKEIFQGLVGKTFKDAVEGTFPSGKIPPSILQEELGPSDNSKTPRRKEFRLKSLENRLAALSEELQFKDDIIAEKDRELIKLTRNLSEYKDKYDFLQRQFSFYKDRGERPGHLNVHDDDSKTDQMTSTRHEFIISEMKRKLEEQLLTINTLREQMQQSRGGYTWYNVPSRSGKHDYLPFSLLAALAVILLSLVCYLVNSYRAADQSSDYTESFWWENSGLLSKFGWYWQDWKENAVQQTSDQAYDRIFGLTDYT
ncbi:hypothetical protein HG536_0E05260 [Torulaspora globosa]|uniref:Monopolar spindle protein 2 n=1 Tax=Torulaspora globosa TaxID=48254 RepID=A0A7G3ZJC9_9SACH|nr:uncharacterized protein HG536_0E05260 [Torulaspora globosa]QLL33615.1 hypothetical protein HG536_0E05260 [Torulaspora globosa]